MSRDTPPSRTTKDLRTQDAALFAQAAMRGLDEAVAMTAAWTRRQLVDVALTLAVASNTPAVLEPEFDYGPLGARRTLAEMEWTDAALRAAHAGWTMGRRDPKTANGERIYQRIISRRKRAAS